MTASREAKGTRLSLLVSPMRLAIQSGIRFGLAAIEEYRESKLWDRRSSCRMKKEQENSRFMELWPW